MIETVFKTILDSACSTHGELCSDWRFVVQSPRFSVSWTLVSGRLVELKVMGEIKNGQNYLPIDFHAQDEESSQDLLFSLLALRDRLPIELAKVFLQAPELFPLLGKQIKEQGLMQSDWFYHWHRPGLAFFAILTWPEQSPSTYRQWSHYFRDYLLDSAWFKSLDESDHYFVNAFELMHCDPVMEHHVLLSKWIKRKEVIQKKKHVGDLLFENQSLRGEWPGQRGTPVLISKRELDEQFHKFIGELYLLIDQEKGMLEARLYLFYRLSAQLKMSYDRFISPDHDQGDICDISQLISSWRFLVKQELDLINPLFVRKTGFISHMLNRFMELISMFFLQYKIQPYYANTKCADKFFQFLKKQGSVNAILPSATSSASGSSGAASQAELDNELRSMLSLLTRVAINLKQINCFQHYDGLQSKKQELIEIRKELLKKIKNSHTDKSEGNHDRACDFTLLKRVLDQLIEKSSGASVDFLEEDLELKALGRRLQVPVFDITFFMRSSVLQPINLDSLSSEGWIETPESRRVHFEIMDWAHKRDLANIKAKIDMFTQESEVLLLKSKGLEQQIQESDLQREELQRQKQEAERQKQEAERQKQEAERQKQEAERQKQEAELINRNLIDHLLRQGVFKTREEALGVCSKGLSGGAFS